MTVTPAWGVSGLTLFTMSAFGTDPDGDPVTFTWRFGGSVVTAPTATTTFGGEGTQNVELTATDGKGGSATMLRSVVIGSLTGRWTGSGVSLGPFTMNLTQAGPVVRGSYSDQIGAGGIPSDLPGTINSLGAVEIRIKQAPYRDWYFRGQMDPSGRRVTGTMHQSGFNGESFYMDKQ